MFTALFFAGCMLAGAVIGKLAAKLLHYGYKIIAAVIVYAVVRRAFK